MISGNLWHLSQDPLASPFSSSMRWMLYPGKAPSLPASHLQMKFHSGRGRPWTHLISTLFHIAEMLFQVVMAERAGLLSLTQLSFIKKLYSKSSRLRIRDLKFTYRIKIPHYDELTEKTGVYCPLPEFCSQTRSLPLGGAGQCLGQNSNAVTQSWYIEGKTDYENKEHHTST